MQVVLSIAGYDPSGGAGVLADIKTFAAFNCFGIAAITSITSQNTLGVFAAYHQPAEVLLAQLEPLVADYDISAVKIGMLPTTQAIETVATFIEKHQLQNVVIDPVIRSSSGYDLIDDAAKKLLLERLLPLADLVTPNLNEARFLSDVSSSTLAHVRNAARTIYKNISHYRTRIGHSAVLVKGGHLEGEPIDVLFDGDEFYEFQAPRISTRHTHGTGCTLSSAIAALLAKGFKIPEATMRAKKYVSEAIRTAPGLGKGAGPLNHLINGFEF